MQDLSKVSDLKWNRIVLEELMWLSVNVLTAYPAVAIDEEVPVHYVGILEVNPITEDARRYSTERRIFSFVRGFSVWRVLGYGLGPYEGPATNESRHDDLFIHRFTRAQSPLMCEYPKLMQWSVATQRGIESFVRQIKRGYFAQERDLAIPDYRRMGLLRGRVPAVLFV